MATMGDFSKKMQKTARATVPTGVDRKVRLVALGIFQQLAFSTPVDTGRARSNWAVALGEPVDLEDEPPFVPGEKGSTAGQNAQMAIAAAFAAMSDRKPQQEIHIGNNLPYIEALNSGSSAQAPAGFVQDAIDNGVQAARNSKILEDKK